MPSIPRLDSPQVDTRTAGFNPIRETTQPDGQALQNLGQAGMNLFKVQKNNADQVAIMEADKKLSSLETQLLYHPKTGAMNKQGKDAFGAVEDTDSQFSSGISEIENSLSSDEQKMAFRKLAQNRQADVSRSMNKHVSGEIQKYDLSETEAYIKTEREAVIQNPYDQSRIDAALQRSQVAVASFGERHGLPDEVVKQSLMEVQSKTHAAVVEQMLAKGDDLAAQKYFAANKDQIIGDQNTHLTKDVEQGSIVGESQRKAQEFYGKGKDLQGALTEARTIADPKVQDATVQRIKELHAQSEMVKKDNDEKLNVSFANMIDQGKDIRGMPGYSQLTTSERANLAAYAKRGIQTDWRVYTDLRDLAGNPKTRDQFAATDLFQYRSKLADGEYEKLIDLREGLRKGDGNANKLADGFQSDDAMVKDVVVNKLKMKPDSLEAADFHELVNSQLTQLQERTGKKASTQDLQQILDNAQVKVVTDKGFFYDSTSPVYDLKKDQDIKDVKLEDIPRAERAKIQDYMSRNKIMDSDSAVINLYKMKLQNMRKK